MVYWDYTYSVFRVLKLTFVSKSSYRPLNIRIILQLAYFYWCRTKIIY